MDIARGEYIYFMDNDDVIMPDALQILLNAAMNSNADMIVATKHFLVHDNTFTTMKRIDKLFFHDRGTMDEVSSDLKQRVREEYGLKHSAAAPWLWFLRRDLLQKTGIRFKKAVIHDDGIFLLELLCATSNIVKINEPFYIWRAHSESLSHSTYDLNGFTRRMKSFLIMLDNFDEILTRALEAEYGEVDHYFIDELCLKIKNRAIVQPMRHAYYHNPEQCDEIIRRELEERYGANVSPLLRTMMHSYLVEVFSNRLADDENNKCKLALQYIKSEVNRVIPFEYNQAN